MFILSSPKDQVSNLIVNNVYSGQILKFMFRFRIKPHCYDKKISIISITHSLKAYFDFIKCFSAFKNYPLSINNL